MRLDKYLWAVRLFKTRSLANKACDRDHVMLNGALSKASKLVKPNDLLAIRVNPIWKQYTVIDIPKSRVGAPLVEDFMIETTAESEIKKLDEIREFNRLNAQAGIKGRPTKKMRRDIGKFKGKG